MLGLTHGHKNLTSSADHTDRMIDLSDVYHFWNLSLDHFCLFLSSVCRGLAHFSREGNGTPLQYSCLENPMDGGAW